MKKLLKGLIPLLAIGTFVPALASCSEKDPSTFESAVYENVATLSDETAYMNDTNNNGADDNGVVVSPYHTLKVNEKDVAVYATRTTYGIHSFAYLMVNEDYVNLSVEVTTKNKKWSSVDVLPKTSGVSASTSNGVTTAKLTDFGSFSFAFNKKYNQPLTIYVAHKEVFSLPEGYTLQEIEPGTYTKAQTQFSSKKVAYYFKKGYYEMNCIQIPGDSVFYFETGTYIKDYLTSSTDYSALFSANRASNVRLYGNVLIDYASHIGGDAGTRGKGHFSFSACNNVIFENFVSIDASSWTLCFTNCNNVEVRNNVLFGYKTCSDGIMLSDCKDSWVHHNYVRSGDDAIEAKSTGSQGSENIIYEYNAVWADKARCYGCIYESNNEMKNITFRHNSVGFALATWSDGVGALAIVLGTNKDVEWHDVHFEDFELYYVKGRAIVFSLAATSELLNYGGGQAKNIYFKNIKVLCNMKVWNELIKIRVSSNCKLGKVYIDNLTYQDLNGSTLKYKQADVEDSLLTSIWTENSWSKNNIVVG